jgi:hypothetical protein
MATRVTGASRAAARTGDVREALPELYYKRG